MMAQMENLRLIADNTTSMVNVVGQSTELRLQDMRRRTMEVALHGVHRGAAVALTAMSLQSNQDLLTVATGFPVAEDPDERKEDIEECVDHAKAVVQITSPKIILQKVFLED